MARAAGRGRSAVGAAVDGGAAGEHVGQNRTALPSLAELLGLPEQAYRLHLRGYSLRAIAAKLGIDKETAHKYVRQLSAELAESRKALREQLQVEAIARLEHLRETAYEHYGATGEAAVLSTILKSEEQLAKLQGLYTGVLDGETSGISITITRRESPREGSASGPRDGNANESQA